MVSLQVKEGMEVLTTKNKCLFTAKGGSTMPRPKSEMTKSGKTIGVRVTASEHEEWIKIGGAKWLRKLLQENRDNRLNVPKSKTT